jgi:Mrp family chromosome partitioning ATPase
MTIIESALEKAKALKTARGMVEAHGTDTHPAESHGHSVATLSHPPTRRSSDLQPPGIHFHAPSYTIDPELARQNRLLLSSSDPRDRGAIAAYGMLRTRLLHRARAKGWTTIGVTSAAPQDGKSLTTINLALSLAREKNNAVVLLDLDMRNPTVCRTLGIAPPVQLREYFEQKTRAAQDLFLSIGFDNLVLAGNTLPTAAAAELLSSSRLEELLEFIRRSVANPMILIDLPPLLSPEDALVVAPRIDALMLVASEGATPRADMLKALDLMRDFQVAGIVLNRSTEIGRKYAYGYGGGYGAG